MRVRQSEWESGWQSEWESEWAREWVSEWARERVTATEWVDSGLIVFSVSLCWQKSIYMSRVLRDACPSAAAVPCVGLQEKRRQAIRNAAQQWESLKACLEPLAQNGTKEEVSPEHSLAQANGHSQPLSPEELRYRREEKGSVWVWDE